jgi:hypothetical protein
MLSVLQLKTETLQTAIQFKLKSAMQFFSKSVKKVKLFTCKHKKTENIVASLQYGNIN